jgi:hypothetical protein
MPLKSSGVFNFLDSIPERVNPSLLLLLEIPRSVRFARSSAIAPPPLVVNNRKRA